MNCHLMTKKYRRARKNGDKFSIVSLLTTLRSEGVHSEYRFSKRYKQVSFSCTNADGAKCCRFKMIAYSNMVRWDEDVITCTDEQEDISLDVACRLADVSLSQLTGWLETAKPGDLLYGADAVKYDLTGTALSYISHLDIYPSHPIKKRCCEAVANIMIPAHHWFCQFINPEKISPDDLQIAVKRLFR